MPDCVMAEIIHLGSGNDGLGRIEQDALGASTMAADGHPKNGDVVKSRKDGSKGVVFAVDPARDLLSVRSVDTNEVHCFSTQNFKNAWELVPDEVSSPGPVPKPKGMAGCLIVLIVLVLVVWGAVSVVSRIFDGPKLTPAEEAGNKARIACIDRMNAHAIATYQNMPSMNELGKACDPAYTAAYNAVLYAPPARPTSSTPAASLPEKPPTAKDIAEWSSGLHYKVLKLEREPYWHCVEDVQLSREIADTELMQISEAIKQHECAGIAPIILNFYLPNMKVGEGSWANAQYEPDATNQNPNFTVKITGMKSEEAASFSAYKVAAGEVLIGSWVDRSNGFVYSIVRKNGKYFENLSIKSQSDGSNDELKEVNSSSGRKFIVVGSSTGDYDVIAPDGSLREYDRDGFIKKLPKL
jgi:Na+-transporting methylmalonyl-CoA/oxaloacetate decarboxylase gamma subunit